MMVIIPLIMMKNILKIGKMSAILVNLGTTTWTSLRTKDSPNSCSDTVAYFQIQWLIRENETYIYIYVNSHLTNHLGVQYFSYLTHYLRVLFRTGTTVIRHSFSVRSKVGGRSLKFHNYYWVMVGSAQRYISSSSIYRGELSFL